MKQLAENYVYDNVQSDIWTVAKTGSHTHTPLLASIHCLARNCPSYFKLICVDGLSFSPQCDQSKLFLNENIVTLKPFAMFSSHYQSNAAI